MTYARYNQITGNASSWWRNKRTRCRCHSVRTYLTIVSIDFRRDVDCCKEDGEAGTELIHVYYSALNFKDVLLATGVLSYEAFVPNRLMQVNESFHFQLTSVT